MGAKNLERRVIQLPIEPGLICLKGLSPTRLRFEVEYGLERGTTANSFLFQEVPRWSIPQAPPLPSPSWRSWRSWSRQRLH